MELSRSTVLVTGAAGFLGQHIVRLLADKNMVREIRSFDIRPFDIASVAPKSSSVRFRHICGDITKPQDIARACVDVDVVFHVAAFIDVTLMPDRKKMDAINIQGTRNVVHACIENGVSTLIGTSSSSSINETVPSHSVDSSSEQATPDNFYSFYSQSKYEAERLVLNANKRVCKNGNVLKTLVIRPLPMYGEGDNYHMVKPLKIVKSLGGTLMRIGFRNTKYQTAYAGNVAWMYIKAWQKLATSTGGRGNHSDDVSGKAFYGTDDTPGVDYFDFVRPLLESRGYRLSRVIVSFWLVYCIVGLMGMFCLVLKPIKKINMDFTKDSLYVACREEHDFDPKHSEIHLDYKPPYTPKESLERSLRFYSTVNLD